MPHVKRYRHLLALGLLLGFALFNSLRTLQQTVVANTNVLASEHVAPLEQALQPIRATLPLTATVGFLGDPSLTSSMYTRLFYASQYSLAPRVVRMVGATPPDLFNQVSIDVDPVSRNIPAVVIAYAPDAAQMRLAASPLGLTLIQQLDAKTALFCRTDLVGSSACPFGR